ALSFSTDAITPEQTALATDFSARLTGQLRTQGILDTASTLDLAPVNLDRVDAGAPLADFIDNFSRLTGTRIQFVKASDPTIFGGAVRSDDAQTIYLNADSQRPVASLIGHEFGHTLQYSNPALYKDLRRVVATYTDSYRARARESAAAPIYRTGPATQRVRTQTAELTNNTLGDAFLDPEFWRSVQNENRPLLQKLWTSFNEWVDSLLTRQSQATWGTPQFATDLTALRRDLAKTIAPALRGMENANATEQSILAFSAEQSTNQSMPEDQRAAKTSGQPSRGGSDAEVWAKENGWPLFPMLPNETGMERLARIQEYAYNILPKSDRSQGVLQNALINLSNAAFQFQEGSTLKWAVQNFNNAKKDLDAIAIRVGIKKDKGGFRLLEKNTQTPNGSRYYNFDYKGQWWSVRVADHANTADRQGIDDFSLSRARSASSMQFPHRLNIVLDQKSTSDKNSLALAKQAVATALEKYNLSNEDAGTYNWLTASLNGESLEFKNDFDLDELLTAQKERQSRAESSPDMLGSGQGRLATSKTGDIASTPTTTPVNPNPTAPSTGARGQAMPDARPDWPDMLSQARSLSYDQFLEIARKGRLQEAVDRPPQFTAGSYQTGLSMGAASGYSLPDIAHWYASIFSNETKSGPLNARSDKFAAYLADPQSKSNPNLQAAFERFKQHVDFETANPNPPAPSTGAVSFAAKPREIAFASEPNPPNVNSDGIPGAIPLDAAGRVEGFSDRSGSQSKQGADSTRSVAAGKGTLGIPAEQAFASIDYAPARTWGLQNLAERFGRLRNSVGGQPIQPPIFRPDFGKHEAAFREAARTAEQVYRDTLASVDAAYADRPGRADSLLPRLPEVRSLFTDSNGQVQLLDSRPVELEKGEALFAAEPKPRSFPQTVAAAPSVAPEVKAQLTALDYDPISNAQTVASARARIDAAGSMDSAVTQFMGNAANPDFQPTAVDYATGIELLGQLQSRGRHEDAAAIADFMSRAGTTQGQAIQALSLISRLTPAGIEAFASRQITRAARNDPKIEELIQDNQRLRAEIATAKRDSATAAIVDNRAAIKAALPAGADAVATNIAIREAILQSPTPLAAQAATARILQDNGLSERAAIRIAQSITKDFLKTTTDSRAKVLQDLLALAETDRRFNKSKLGSLIRLNREGKLTDSRLHADMAKMLGIPAWTAEHSAKVQDLLRQREAATDPRVKLVKAAEALDVIYRESMPPGMLAKIDTFQTLMMLLNPKTWIRNIAGNAFMFGADLSADTVAWGADAATSIVTGSRTRTGLDLATRITSLGAGLGDIRAGYEFGRTQGLGRLGSFKEGVQTLIRLGRLYSSKKYDSAELTGFTGTTFQSGIGKLLEDTLGAALSLADRGFYESAFRASLENRMRTAAVNGNPVAAPTPDMIAEARMDAGRAVYQDDNAASRTLSGLRRVLNQLTGSARWGLGSMLMKFTQVPGSILMRGIEFSPFGFIRNAYQLLAPALNSRVAFDQKAFTEQFSRALVGTTGLVATGYWLAQLGIISAGRENEDEKKRNLAKAEGWGSYKLNVSALKRALITGNFWTRQPRQDGDVVVNYDWAQPLSISVAMGAYAKENQKAVQEDILRGKKQSLLATGFNWMSAAAASATGAMNALVEQPLLSGLSTFFRNAAYDDIPGAILAAASDVPKSMMPTAARQWMQLEDNTVRETRDSSAFRQYVNELKSQLPGLSQTLPAKRDILGNDVERYQRDSNTIFNVLFNPSMVTYIKKSPVLTEMSRVYEMTGNPSVIPNQAARDFTLEGVKVRLTSEEISALQQDMGALSVAAVEKFVLDDPRYAQATWDTKAQAFTRALEKAATAAKYRILLSRPDLKQRAQIEHQQTLQRRQEMQQMLDSGVGKALMQ
ncbi:MAG: hypothetical protein KGR46_11750, partial [Verrucomicrobia bacterium]|nr:hypothetical protein [Verrucomicrobiota bacterium]